MKSELERLRLPQRQALRLLTRKAPAQALRWMGRTVLSRRVVSSAELRMGEALLIASRHLAWCLELPSTNDTPSLYSMSISVARRVLGHAFCLECECDVLQMAQCLHCETQLSGA